MSVEQQTIRQVVFEDMYVNVITTKLEDQPGEILAAKEQIVELEDKLKYDTAVKDAKQAVVDLEVEIAYEVRNEVWIPYEIKEGLTWGDTGCTDKNEGKPKFTNEEQRKTETRRQLVGNEYYVGLKNNVGLALRAQSVIEMDRGKAHARLAAIEAENHNLRSIAAMIAGLAHESTTSTTHRHMTTVKLGEN